MNKNDLVNQIVKELPQISKNKAEQAIEAILSIISEALSKGEKITLSGFGSFYVAQRQQKRGVNPKTRQPMIIEAASVPKFRPGKELKEKIK